MPCGGCNCKDGISPVPGRWEVPGVLEATSVCPSRLIPTDFDIVTAWLPHYRNGNLWVAGGISDQPVIYLEAMATLERAIARLAKSN